MSIAYGGQGLERVLVTIAYVIRYGKESRVLVTQNRSVKSQKVSITRFLQWDPPVGPTLVSTAAMVMGITGNVLIVYIFFG